MITAVTKELTDHIIPFWEGLADREYGGFYGYLDYNLHLDRKAVKGCILNSRILWFFSNACLVLGDPALLSFAENAYHFMEAHCFDRDNGGVYWSVTYDGRPEDTTKHTYNQAFAIYALASYAAASHAAQSGEGERAIEEAIDLFHLIESRMRDEGGYLEAFTKDFRPESNQKLSENGVLAERTMNTLLHVVEAYTELHRVAGMLWQTTEKNRQQIQEIRTALVGALEIMETKLWNPKERYLTVFMDHDYRSLLNLDSYGHDIEAAWLIDRAVEVLGEGCDSSAFREFADRMHHMTSELTANVYEKAFDGQSIPVEIQDGKVKGDRVWWVQCEAVTGFLQGYVRDGREEYKEAAGKTWDYIQEYVIDPREGSEWFWYVNPDGTPAKEPIVEPWKCPYHNGRMCMEVMRRGITC